MQLLGKLRWRRGCGFQSGPEPSNCTRSHIASFEHRLGERAAVHVLQLTAHR
jgi:hypothetical protein